MIQTKYFHAPANKCDERRRFLQDKTGRKQIKMVYYRFDHVILIVFIKTKYFAQIERHKTHRNRELK